MYDLTTIKKLNDQAYADSRAGLQELSKDALIDKLLARGKEARRLKMVIRAQREILRIYKHVDKIA